MSESCVRGRVTASERAEVLRLRAEDVSVRKTAELVFGDARYRGRVERIVANAGRRVAVALPHGVTAAEAEGLSTVELIALFVERRLAFLVESGALPSTRELGQLLELQRQLEAWRQLKRAQERRRAAR